MGNVSLAPEPYEYARLKEPDRPMRLFYLEEYHENTHKNPPNSASVQDNLQEESQISGHLKHISIDDHPKYVALSYTWGSLETPFRIPVDGSYLNITANLHAVLGVLAKLPQLQGRPLWIDAICINQRNEDVKNCQVPLMGKIYSEANEVLTRDLFQEYGPRILAYRQPNLNEPEDLPSWYIDWTRVEQGLALFDPAQPLYIYASGNEKWCSEKRHMGNELQLPLEGITVSTVDLIANLEINPSLETSPPMGGNTSADPSPWELEDRIQDGEQVKESTSWIRPMETLLSESHEDSPARAASKLSSKQSLWVVPIAGEQDGRYPLVSDSSPGCTKEAFQTVIGERKADGASKEGIWEYWRRLKLNGNKGFVTSDGWAGLGRRTVQKEDLIVIFKGCKFPFLIRPRCEERKEYELVGACYVDGIMYGEAMEEDPTLEGMFLV
ncbi:heterokaryon incompatibility protein-domain-containing protein [Phyllosticta citrichinensis]